MDERQSFFWGLMGQIWFRIRFRIWFWIQFRIQFWIQFWIRFQIWKFFNLSTHCFPFWQYYFIKLFNAGLQCEANLLKLFFWRFIKTQAEFKTQKSFSLIALFEYTLRVDLLNMHIFFKPQPLQGHSSCGYTGLANRKFEKKNCNAKSRDWCQG